jgi:hypothetical protein
MTEDQLRAIIRDVVARHVGPPQRPSGAAELWRTHASHLRLPVAAGAEGDGPCIIEPAIPCHHCGYCQSLGH